MMSSHLLDLRPYGRKITTELVVEPTPSLLLPQEDLQAMPSNEAIEPIFPDPAREIEYERLFTEQPRDLNDQFTWLRQLQKVHDKAWYDDFFEWYARRLESWATPPTPRIRILPTIESVSNLATWHPTKPEIKTLTDFLFSGHISPDPDLYVGQYNGFRVSVLLNGSALDPPHVGIKTFKSLGVKYAHLPVFTGLRIQESADDLCLLVLGNIYASMNIIPSDDDDWFDTRFVLALDAGSGRRMCEFYLVYKYDVHSTEYLDDGSEKRTEEVEHEKPPQFCNGPDAFTVAVFQTKRLGNAGLKEKSSCSNSIKLAVRSVKKPDLVVAGYVDDKRPYVPVFPARDD